MSDFADYCCERLSSLGPCRARRMFGGHGLSVEGINVGLIIAERLYLKVDAQTRPAFEAAGCESFTYRRKEGPVVALGYWSAPSEAMDSPRLMAPWAQRALEAALRARTGTRSRRKA